jgi:hypothetical protein
VSPVVPYTRPTAPKSRPVHIAPVLTLAVVVLTSCAGRAGDDREAATARPPGGVAPGALAAAPVNAGDVVYFDDGRARLAIVAGAETVLGLGDLLAPPGGGGWRITATRQGMAIRIRRETDIGGRPRQDDYIVQLARLPITVADAGLAIQLVGTFLMVPQSGR